MQHNLNEKAVKDLLFRMADDALIIGHRNSEWTGLGPIIEEDIAFSSMAQDKLGHAQALYTILNQLGEKDPDAIAFGRSENEFKCCHFVELPIGEYDFSIMRQFLFDHAEFLRYQALSTSTFEPLAKVARKVKGEIKYHLFHADTWIAQLGKGTEESHARMQSALNYAFPFALGMFEPSEFEPELMNEGVFLGEEALYEEWLSAITPILEKAGFSLSRLAAATPIFGGRKGYHTEHLKPLLDEMTEVFALDPSAEW